MAVGRKHSAFTFLAVRRVVLQVKAQLCVRLFTQLPGNIGDLDLLAAATFKSVENHLDFSTAGSRFPRCASWSSTSTSRASMVCPFGLTSATLLRRAVRRHFV